MQFFTHIMMICLTIIWSTSAVAQEPSYLHFTVEDGLPSNLVYCAEQDDNGFIWFGTDQGLARFDGTRFKTYGIKEGLPDPDVLKIFNDSQGRLWISCFQKKPCYFKDGKFFTAENDNLLAQTELSTGTYNFFEDSDESIWVTGDNAYSCRIGSDEVSCFLNPPHPYFGEKVKMSTWKINAYNNQKYIFQRGALSCREIDVNGISTEWEYLGSKNIVPDKGEYDYAFYENKLLSLSTNFLSLLRFEENDIVLIQKIHTTNSANHISEVKKNVFWVTGKKRGIYKYLIQEDSLILRTTLFKEKRINSVFQDKDLNSWFSSSGEGVFMIPENNVYTYNRGSGQPFKANIFTAVNKSPNGDLILGDKAGYIYSLKAGNWNWNKIGNGKYSDYEIEEIFTTRNINWLGFSKTKVFGGGGEDLLIDYVYVTKKEKAKWMGAVKALTIDEYGEIWVGTSHALIRYTKDGRTQEGVYKRRVSNLCVDEEGVVWMGDSNGITSEVDDFNINWRDRFPLLACRTIDIERGANNTLWIATSTHGVLRAKVSSGRIESVEKIQDYIGAKIENIKGIYVGENGLPWVYTNNGIYHILSDWSVEHYNILDGLADNDVNSIAIDNDTLWAATSSGLTCLPLNFRKENIDVSVLVMGMKYDLNDEVEQIDLVNLGREQKDIFLPYGAVNVNVEMAALDFQYAKKLKYEYIASEVFMPIQHMTWRNLKRSLFGQCDTLIVESGLLNYGTQMTAGGQAINVSAIMPSGNKGVRNDTITIVALPHWSNTIWFSLLMVIILFFIFRKIYLASTAYRRMENRANKLQLQTIKSQINPHFVGNSVNAIQQFFYPPDPKRASEYISIFTNLLRKSILFAEKSFVPIGEELSFVNDYLRMVQLRFGERFDYDINGVDIIDPNILFPTMILQPILENATIHGLAEEGDSFLILKFLVDKKRIKCTVTDNGPGIYVSQKIKKESKPGRKSNGISLLKKKVMTLNRLYNIDLRLEFSDLSKRRKGQTGTEVCISYDYRKNKENENSSL